MFLSSERGTSFFNFRVNPAEGYRHATSSRLHRGLTAPSAAQLSRDWSPLVLVFLTCARALQLMSRGPEPSMEVSFVGKRALVTGAGKGEVTKVNMRTRSDTCRLL